MISEIKYVYKHKIFFALAIITTIILLLLAVKAVMKYNAKVKEIRTKELIVRVRNADDLKIKGNMKEAFEEYKTIEKITQEPAEKLEAEFMQANIDAHQFNNTLKAREIYLAIIDEREEYKQTPQRVIDSLTEMGLIYWNEQNYQRSARMYEIAINEYPERINYSEVAWNLGACYQLLGESKKAAKIIAESKKRKRR
jgi:tetratricopeptide (TPR) repeat protein